MTYKICVCIPTFFRPYGLRRVLQSIQDTARFDNVPGLTVDASVAYEQDDKDAETIIKAYGAIPAPCEIPRNGTSYCWNTAMKAAMDYDAYVLGSDDLYFLLGIWTETVKQIQAGFGFVGFNDNDIRELRVNKDTCKVMRNPDYVCHYLMTREFIIRYHGGMMCIPAYDGWWLDVEACDRAKRAGQFVHSLDANIKHDWKGAAGHGGHYEKNKAIYEGRKAAGFPDDFEPILTDDKIKPRTAILQEVKGIPVYLTDEEKMTLYDLACEVPAGGNILEIGSLYGGSTAILGKGAPTAHITSIDWFQFFPAGPTSAESVKQTLENMGINNITFRVEDSRQAVHDGSKIDLLWIDGGHDYETALHDLMTFGPYAKVIAMHDFGSKDLPGVKKAYDKFHKKYIQRNVKFTVHCLAVIRKDE